MPTSAAATMTSSRTFMPVRGSRPGAVVVPVLATVVIPPSVPVGCAEVDGGDAPAAGSGTGGIGVSPDAMLVGRRGR
jgi:hypothetical protein